MAERISSSLTSKSKQDCIRYASRLIKLRAEICSSTSLRPAVPPQGHSITRPRSWSQADTLYSDDEVDDDEEDEMTVDDDVDTFYLDGPQGFSGMSRSGPGHHHTRQQHWMRSRSSLVSLALPPCPRLPHTLPMSRSDESLDLLPRIDRNPVIRHRPVSFESCLTEDTFSDFNVHSSSDPACYLSMPPSAAAAASVARQRRERVHAHFRSAGSIFYPSLMTTRA